MGKFVNEYIVKDTGLKDGCIVSSFYLPEENWPIEKIFYRYVGLLIGIKTCYKRNGLESLFFDWWFLTPLCDDHEGAYTCISPSFVLKENKNRFVNNRFR